MAKYRVVPKVTYENTTVFGPKAMRGWKVPAGVTAHEPIWLSFGEMSKKEPTKLPAPAGLTKSAVDIEAAGVSKVSGSGTSGGGGGAGGTQWTFTGGDIVLNILISIYIIDKFAPVPKLLKLIMEHEYIHVHDTLDLSQRIEGMIQKDATLKPWLAGDPWTGSAFFDRIGALWGKEAKRLGDHLDSGAGYDKHKREIARLMPR